MLKERFCLTANGYYGTREHGTEYRESNGITQSHGEVKEDLSGRAAWHGAIGRKTGQRETFIKRLQTAF